MTSYWESMSMHLGSIVRARRLLGRCTCRWEPANILGLDIAERITETACPRHGTPVIPPGGPDA